MANNKNTDQKLPGEKEAGKFHYNPGNMSGKTVGTNKDETRGDSIRSGQQQPDKEQKNRR